ncbi:hypothetical protein ACOSQ2_025289 [Xanthoceras sorbifolium]
MAMILSFFGNQRNNGLFDPFSVDVWDPFRDFPVPSFSSQFPQETSAFVNTRVDWKVTPEAHLFKADLPGLKKEEVKVEGSSGKFSRRFRLPENVNMDQIKACMENGVLTVTAPKQEVKKPDVKAIEISG